MSNVDYLDVDARGLQLLLAVHEEGSVTAAAARLGVTQSAVSHQLDRLRSILGDPLFVKSGRGIAPTRRADELALQAAKLLEDIRSFATPQALDLSSLEETLVVAANDLQSGLLLPPLLARLRTKSPGVSIRVISADIPDADMLRRGRCRLVISPRPPDATDIKQRKLFDGEYAVFHDPCVRRAPTGLEDYLAADHVSVRYEPDRRLEVDRFLDEAGFVRRFAAHVPNFSGIPDFLRGTDMLATLPRHLQKGVMRELEASPPPVACPEFRMYLIWHLRDDFDPFINWVKSELITLARPLGNSV